MSFSHLNISRLDSRPLELPHELFQVDFDDLVQVHQFAVGVVDDLHLGRGPQEVQRRAAGENFHVALVRREARDELIGQASFAPDPRNDGQYQGETPGVEHLPRLPGGGRALAGLTGLRTAQSDVRHYVVKQRPAVAPQIADWEVANRATDGELAAMARRYFDKHNRMVGTP
jgi:hypothetical protein